MVILQPCLGEQHIALLQNLLQMEQSYIEYFHGNNREIENEKQRKRELMSHFPKMLGTVDETRYVLHDDENKSKQTDYFESKPVSPLTPPAPSKNEPIPGIAGIGGLQSEKPKKDDNGQTMAQGLANWGNNGNAIGFGNGKDVATSLNPQNEKNETKAPKSPFDFDGNTAKEEGNPFQFHGLGTATGSKPRTTTVRNDSLRLEGRKIESVADTVWNTNSSLGLDKNNQPPTAKTRLYVHGKPRTKDYAVQIDTLIGNLPVAASNILKQHVAEIEVLDNLYTTTDKGEYRKRNGIYLDKSNRIYIDSKYVNEHTMFSEAVHVVQDYLGMTGIGKSNLEFQEHVIKDLYYNQKRRKLNGDNGYDEHSASKDNDYIFLMDTAIDKEGVLDLNKFLAGINKFINSFQEEYVPSNSYQTPAVEGFKYNWIKLLQIFGIEYK